MQELIIEKTSCKANGCLAAGGVGGLEDVLSQAT